MQSLKPVLRHKSIAAPRVEVSSLRIPIWESVRWELVQSDKQSQELLPNATAAEATAAAEASERKEARATMGMRVFICLRIVNCSDCEVTEVVDGKKFEWDVGL